MSVTHMVAQFTKGARLEDAPPEAIDRARLCLLDTLGVAVAGSRTRAANLTTAYVLGVFPPGPATLLGVASGLNPEGAVLANAVSASALDFDDGHRVALMPRGVNEVVGHAAGHPSAVIVPPALAVGQARGSTSEELLSAILMAYEASIRIAAGRRLPIVLDNVTGNWGAFASALAAGRLRHLTADGLARALGLAAALGPNPPRQPSLSSMTMVKESIGWSALTGVACADLAERGFTGREEILDDPTAFEPETFADLGKQWTILGGYFKPHTACRLAHAAIDAVLTLRKTHGFSPTGLREIVVWTSQRGTLLNNPAPSTIEAGQYSLPFSIAVAWCRGHVDPGTVDEAALADPAILAAARRIRLAVDPKQAGRTALERDFPVQNRAEVEVVTDAGSFRAAVEAPRGDVDNPLSRDEVYGKFYDNTRSCWSPGRADAIREWVERLPAGPRLDALSELLRPDVPDGAAGTMTKGSSTGGGKNRGGGNRRCRHRDRGGE